MPVVPASGRSPQYEKAKLSDRGTLLIQGYSYVDASYRKIHLWDGELDMSGTLVVDKTAPRPRPKPGTMEIQVEH